MRVVRMVRMVRTVRPAATGNGEGNGNGTKNRSQWTYDLEDWKETVRPPGRMRDSAKRKWVNEEVDDLVMKLMDVVLDAVTTVATEKSRIEESRNQSLEILRNALKTVSERERKLFASELDKLHVGNGDEPDR